MTYDPCLVIEVYLYHILCVLSVVNWVNVDPCLLDADAQRNLEEVRSVIPIVFVTSLHMVNEDFRGEEHLAELALHGLRMLEHSLEYLDGSDLLLQLLVSLLNLGDGLR